MLWSWISYVHTVVLVVCCVRMQRKENIRSELYTVRVSPESARTRLCVSEASPCILCRSINYDNFDRYAVFSTFSYEKNSSCFSFTVSTWRRHISITENIDGAGMRVISHSKLVATGYGKWLEKGHLEIDRRPPCFCIHGSEYIAFAKYSYLIHPRRILYVCSHAF